MNMRENDDFSSEITLEIQSEYPTWDFTPYIPLYCEIYGRIDGDLELTEEQIKFLCNDGQKIVSACIKRYGNKSLDYDELRPECLIAVAKALKLYDPSRANVKVSTYVWKCCENRVKMALRQLRGGQEQYEIFGRRPAWMIPLEKFLDPNMDGFEEWDLHEARRSWLDKVIDEPATGLSDRERIVIRLTIAGFPQVHISQVVKVNQSCVSTTKTSAMTKIKAALTRAREHSPCFLDG